MRAEAKRILKMLEPIPEGSYGQRLGRLRRRLFAETGLVMGGLHQTASWARNRESSRRRRAVAQKLEYSPEERAELENLRDRRFHRLSPFAPELLRAVVAYGESFRERYGDVSIHDVEAAREGEQNTFFHNVYEGELGDPFRALAVHPRLVKLAAGYFGELPVLQDIEVNLSPVDTRGRPHVGSQRWHRDIDQPSKLKLFVLLHQTGVEHGPTLVLPNSQSTLDLHPNFPGTFDDHEAERAGIDLSSRTEFVGAPGDMLMVDTGRLIHAGSRNVREPRLLLIITYGPPRSRLTARNELRCLRAPHLAAENDFIRHMAETSTR